MRVKQANSSNLVVSSNLDKLFLEWERKKSGDRSGLHASAIISSEQDFCYRRHILEFFFEKRRMPQLPVRLLRIFLNGWYVHIKWQELFVSAGIAETVEKTHYFDEYDLFFTPDAIISINGNKYIVEIKSMNTRDFQALKSPPANAVRQAQFYMAMAGIPQAIILVEDKNNQVHKDWVVDFDLEESVPFIKRLENIKQLKDAFAQAERLPRRTCENSKCKKSQNCDVAHVCWMKKDERVDYEKDRSI